ncbi:hypothetical protein QR79_24775 [Methylobacterium indicum]|uniref:Uncharacterized protein n=1 Tax=Methylobacterium indicum TaxID=1775910 RepID=A0ABR5GXX1_9HYPH|nr:hypothetical protein QR79_24775 [Methylobacterium indicum]
MLGVSSTRVGPRQFGIAPPDGAGGRAAEKSIRSWASAAGARASCGRQAAKATPTASAATALRLSEVTRAVVRAWRRRPCGLEWQPSRAVSQRMVSAPASGTSRPASSAQGAGSG